MSTVVECPQCDYEFRLRPDVIDDIKDEQFCICGKVADKHGSSLVGTLPRCSSCLEAIGLPA